MALVRAHFISTGEYSPDEEAVEDVLLSGDTQGKSA